MPIAHAVPPAAAAVAVLVAAEVPTTLATGTVAATTRLLWMWNMIILFGPITFEITLDQFAAARCEVSINQGDTKFF